MPGACGEWAAQASNLRECQAGFQVPFHSALPVALRSRRSGWKSRDNEGRPSEDADLILKPLVTSTIETLHASRPYGNNRLLRVGCSP